jgi:hypothetical protein
MELLCHLGKMGPSAKWPVSFLVAFGLILDASAFDDDVPADDCIAYFCEGPLDGAAPEDPVEGAVPEDPVDFSEPPFAPSLFGGPLSFVPLSFVPLSFLALSW